MLRLAAMTDTDYDAAAGLWASIPELGFAPGFDTQDRIAAYLARNPGLSTLAWAGENLAGAVLCGHDGRRGSLYHMAVARAFRRRGIGRQMLERCLIGLRAEGITTAFLFVHAENLGAATFWSAVGWSYLPQIGYYARSF